MTAYPQLIFKMVTKTSSTYELHVRWAPRTPAVLLGLVQKHGSLRSMQSWSAKRTGAKSWTRSRQTRKDAAMDLIALAQAAPERSTRESVSC